MALKEVKNEAELLKGVAAGDDRAFASLFYAYYNQVAEFVQSVTHDFSLTEEIVQDVFTKVWENRGQLLSVKKFTAYLFILTRNHTLNTIRDAVTERKEREQYERLLNWETEPAEIDKETLPEYGAWMDRAASMLPPQQQQVFALRRQGLKNPEIARQMNLSTDSVKKYYQLALRAITEFVKAQGLICLILCLYLFLPALAKAQNGQLKDARAALKGDTLTLDNSVLKQRYLWNNGDLMLLDMQDKRSRKSLASISIGPAQTGFGEEPYLEVQICSNGR